MSASRHCPVCDAGPAQSRLFMAENIDAAKLSGFSFASRKEPEFMCHRLVSCTVCGLVYADQPPEEGRLAAAYHQAEYDSAVEAEDAARSYVQAIRPVLAALPRRESALEIGAGTGVFLESLQGEGFSQLVGVEPSTAAIAAAPPQRRAWLREGMFNESDFAPGSFDLICCFMTMEHVRDPAAVAGAAFRLLRAGGAFVIVTHDYRSAVNRLMGKKSPIIDIEHLQLFSTDSVQRLLSGCGFERISIRAFVNRYALRYWTRLLPLPSSAKSALTSLFSALGLADRKVGLNAGNQISAGFKPR